MMRARLTAVALACCLSGTALQGGGPLQFTGGGPVVWDTTTPIVCRIDRGPLGPIAASDIEPMIKAALNTWGAVKTASLRFQYTSLPADVRTTAAYLALVNDPASGNVVVLDDRGTIVEDLYGPDNVSAILGFAKPWIRDGRIGRFVSLINGAPATVASVRGTLVHEFGHALGLDHAQINAPFAGNNSQDDDQFLPTMFPTSGDDDVSLAELNPDDEAWISRLYPSASFGSAYGTLVGRLLRADQTPVLGANVLATAVDNHGRLNLMNRFSCVSDYLQAADGGFDFRLPPGTYRISVEPVQRNFVGGSSVGPYAQTPSAQSFTNPVKAQAFTSTFTIRAGASTDAGVVTLK